jgi:teichuronic acid biosynthesis glycosyltransferase TuaC
MKILTFTSLFPNGARPELGVFIYQRTRHIAELPHTTVEVVAPIPYWPEWLPSSRWSAYGTIGRQETFGGLTTWHPRYPLLPMISMPFHGLLMFLGALGTARRLHRRFVFDCIDAHYVYPDGHAAVLLGKFLGIPVIVSARGTDINVFPSLALIRPLIRWTLQRASGLIAVSGALKDRMVQAGAAGENIRVIPNGVDTSRFGAMDRDEARRSLGIPTPGAVILSVGSLVHVKRQEALIEAVAQIVAQMPEVRAYIVGEGPRLAELEELVRKANMERNFFLVGGKPNAELHRWFSAADVSCLVSAREGWPNVVMESLACGTPVVATAVGGIPEIITSTELGLLVAAEPASIAQGISHALKTKWDREKLVQYARSRSWDVVAEEVEEYLSTVTKMTAEKTSRPFFGKNKRDV